MTATTFASTVPTSISHDGEQYPEFLASVQQAFQHALSDPNARIFTTDAGDNLYQDFLALLPADRRQHYNCRCCATFTRRFGSLVTIQADGRTVPLMWRDGDVPAFFAPAVHRLHRRVQEARVTGVFLCSDNVWGTPQTGPWTHLAITPPPTHVYRGLVKTAGQMMAAKREDFRTMITALEELSLATVLTALPLLESESLYRSEALLGAARWLREVFESRNLHRARKDNVLWRSIATAPAGFCRPRGTMLGKLLEDISAGLPFPDVKRRFEAEMHPLKRLRPQVPPSSGNIAQAEKIIAKLNAADALRRRYATLDDLQTIWLPPISKSERTKKSGTGVFDHVTPKASSKPATEKTVSSLGPPPVRMTFVKFMATVLPYAASIEIELPYHKWNYVGLVTAVNPEAPPILQWDREEQRNPVSWYVYHDGSPAAQWGLKAGAWTKVSAVTLRPSMWYNNDMAHLGKGVIFVLEGAKDSGDPTLCLFPEILKSEFHPIRATIESFSRTGRIEEVEAPACGVTFATGGTWGGAWGMIRVINRDGATMIYQLDRWD